MATSSRTRIALFAALLLLALSAAAGVRAEAAPATPAAPAAPTAPRTAAAPAQTAPAPDAPIGTANCGPGSAPESGTQGRVPRAERQSGRSRSPYTCNLKKLGGVRGAGAGVVSARYGNCVFLGSFATSLLLSRPGVQVVDVSNPASPRIVRTLRSPAMAAGTWETLRVDENRGLLVAVGTSLVVGSLLFDVYDIKTDCKNPRLLNGAFGSNTVSLPVAVLGHEGGFSPDGRTYYAASLLGGWISAISLDDPTRPRAIWNGSVGLTNHGFSISDDGNTFYGVTIFPAGVQVLDVSDIQARRSYPQIRQISQTSWSDGLVSQHTIPITQDGVPYLIAVDEGGSGGVRVFDISDPTSLRLVRNIRLDIQRPERRQQRIDDYAGNGLWGYEAHYCTVDRRNDPTALACGMTLSGIRVFDISTITQPREIAYYNPGGVGGNVFSNLSNLPNSVQVVAAYLPTAMNPNDLTIGNVVASVKPDMTTDWCMSPPWFVGSNQLWASCSSNGFFALQFTNGAYQRP